MLQAPTQVLLPTPPLRVHFQHRRRSPEPIPWFPNHIQSNFSEILKLRLTKTQKPTGTWKSAALLWKMTTSYCWKKKKSSTSITAFGRWLKKTGNWENSFRPISEFYGWPMCPKISMWAFRIFRSNAFSRKTAILDRQSILRLTGPAGITILASRYQFFLAQ